MTDAPCTPVVHHYPKAQDAYPRQAIPPLTLHFHAAMQEGILLPISLEDLRQTFQADGQALCNDLVAHLPGGLVDALFGALCAYKASLYVVAHRPPAGSTEETPCPA